MCLFNVVADDSIANIRFFKKKEVTASKSVGCKSKHFKKHLVFIIIYYK